MADAPERIWAFLYTGSRVKGEFQTTSISWGTEYVRADIAASQLAEARAEYLSASKDAMELAGKLNAAEAENARLRALPLKDEVERVLDDASAIIAKLEERAAEDVMYDGRPVEKWCSDYASIIERLRAGEQEEWRPIKTAPKDGENILYRNKFRDIGFCHWDEGYDEGDQPCWWDNEADQEVCPVIWLPADILPAFPAAPSNQGGDRG